MAWTSMHFAVGMGCAGVLTGAACIVFRRGWRFIPVSMTLGGFFALIPDAPRLFREDFPSLPFASTLGDKQLERSLHSFGDMFFFHNALDHQPNEYALHGMAMIVLFYNLSIALMWFLERRQRNTVANRNWRAHKAVRKRYTRHRQEHPLPSATYAAPTEDGLPPGTVTAGDAPTLTIERDTDPDSPVVAQIKGDDHYPRTG